MSGNGSADLLLLLIIEKARNMKIKSFLVCGLLVAGVSVASAQSAYDALNFSHNDLALGTARYSAMAGAMGAFGGDASTLRDNPAGLGVYRSCDLNFTPNLYLDNDNSLGINVNNFGVVLNFGKKGNKSGYITSSLGIGYDRLKNFSRTTNEDVYVDGEPYDYTTYKEDGGIGEWNFSYGLNISNRLYLGLGFGVASLDYEGTTLYEEAVVDGHYLDDRLDVSGTGWNFKIGAIVRATDFMRVGLAFHTPTYYNGVKEYEDVIQSTDVIGDELWDSYERSYDFQTPLKLQGSLGFVIGKHALLGIEYNYQDYKAMKVDGRYVGAGASRDYDRVFDDEMEASHTIKVGAEVMVAKNVAVRAGFAHVTEPIRDLSEGDVELKEIPYSIALPKQTNYITVGAGYKGRVFYCDLAYVHKIKKEHYYGVSYWELDEDNMPIYNIPTSPSEVTGHNNNITLTFGWRF